MSEVLRIDAVVERDTFSVTAAFEAHAGRPLALVGPNGSGKSTLVAAIAGLLPLASGRIGVDTAELSSTVSVVAPELRRVGVVFQDFLLFPHLSVRDNIAFAMRVRGAGRADARREAQTWLDRFELDQLSALYPSQISGGQRQRVALARTLASDPEVLLLDEPMASLDVEVREEVRADLARHLRDVRLPTVLVTHDRADIDALAHDIVVLQNGRVTQHGVPDELRRHPATAYISQLMRA